jgi:hypothetical protein
MRWAGHAEGMGRMKNAYRKPDGKRTWKMRR